MENFAGDRDMEETTGGGQDRRETPLTPSRTRMRTHTTTCRSPLSPSNLKKSSSKKKALAFGNSLKGASGRDQEMFSDLKTADCSTPKDVLLKKAISPAEKHSTRLELSPRWFSVDNYKKLVFKNNGVLFENDLLQIEVGCEYLVNLGLIILFYRNKTAFPMLGFTPSIHCDGDLGGKLVVVLVKSIDSTVEAGAQVQQSVNIECVEDFVEYPTLVVSFLYNNQQQKLNLKVPVTINKFFKATDMNGETFVERWDELGPQHETHRIFKATQPMDTSATVSKLSRFGMQLLTGIDPNPDNFACAAILYTKSEQIGCLLKLELNYQAQMYRLTIRASKESVSKKICELLGESFGVVQRSDPERLLDQRGCRVKFTRDLLLEWHDSYQKYPLNVFPRLKEHLWSKEKAAYECPVRNCGLELEYKTLVLCIDHFLVTHLETDSKGVQFKGFLCQSCYKDKKNHSKTQKNRYRILSDLIEHGRTEHPNCEWRPLLITAIDEDT